MKADNGYVIMIGLKTCRISDTRIMRKFILQTDAAFNCWPRRRRYGIYQKRTEGFYHQICHPVRRALGAVAVEDRVGSDLALQDLPCWPGTS
jgi:hypothetical protein